VTEATRPRAAGETLAKRLGKRLQSDTDRKVRTGLRSSYVLYRVHVLDYKLQLGAL
jgi:hypothetical protein